MIFIICFITIPIVLLLAGYCLGKALDIKFKNDVDINNWWNNSEESVWGDKIIQHNTRKDSL
jgi:hypothetical protein